MMQNTLPCRVNFIHGNLSEWRDVAADRVGGLTPTVLAPRIRFGREIWIIQAFLAFRDLDYQVTLSDHLEPGAINVVHADDVQRLHQPWRHFVVSIRADRDPVFWSQVEIVQNRFSVWSHRHHFIPHWPQPGLLPREAGRVGCIETVVYMGHPWNLAPELQGPTFRRSLSELGMRIELRDTDWWDYRECDVVLALRHGTPFFLSTKPASKLVNAWMAGCPAILSRETAYSEVRETPLDYFEASDAKGVIDALRVLRTDAGLEKRMIRNGRERAIEYSWTAIARRWEEAFKGPVFEAFCNWRVSPAPQWFRQGVFRLQSVRRRIWGSQTIQGGLSPFRLRANGVRRVLTVPASAVIPVEVPSGRCTPQDVTVRPTQGG